MIWRQKTLKRIKTRRQEKQTANKLQRQPYWKMDELALKRYGLHKCRISVAKKLITRVFAIFQLTFIFLYLLTVIAYFIALDAMRDDLFNEQAHASMRAEDRFDAMDVIFLAEFALICAFLAGSILNCVGFGLLYVNRITTVANWILMAVNVVLLVAFSQDPSLRYSIFGVKQLSSVALLVFRLDQAQEKVRQPAEAGKEIQVQRRPSLDVITVPASAHSRKISSSSDHLNVPSIDNQNVGPSKLRHRRNSSNPIEVVSVREKVILELKAVQERVGEEDADADVALEYCIKMITANQLNEQDLEQGSDHFDHSGEESMSEHAEDHKDKPEEMRHIMKAWYS